MSSKLEEDLSASLDFQKLSGIAATGQPVIPVVLQHAETGEVLFVGYANELALRATLDERTAVLWSTSRNELWRKGMTSGDVLHVVDVRVNCEQNSLLYRVVPARSGACHTKDRDGVARRSCYYRQLASVDQLEFVAGLD